jgi:hypothetical protein
MTSAPHYLPDGRIVFSSTRQRQSRRSCSTKASRSSMRRPRTRREPSFVLHVMNADGTGIHQISFGQSHDMDPTVLMNGACSSAAGTPHRPQRIHLYTANPDGTDLQLHYGALSQPNTGTNNDRGAVHAAARDAGRPHPRRWCARSPTPTSAATW